MGKDLSWTRFCLNSFSASICGALPGLGCQAHAEGIGDLHLCKLRRRRKFRRQLVTVEVDPREVDALIERGYL